MRRIRAALSAAIVGGLWLSASALAPVAAQTEAPAPPPQQWSFTGPFGAFDLAAAQRGFQVYQEVCSLCHSMNLLHYRDLSGIGLSPDQIKAVAASATVPLGLNDQGEPITGPGTPASVFRAPFPNDKASRAANGGALPPDQSLLVNAREDGANYIYALMTGYENPPAGMQMQQGMNYNKYFPGHQIAMPQPLNDDQVTYADGTKATIAQEAHDVVTFLYWAANPEMVTRKQVGVRVVLFLVLMTGLTYAVKKKVWADVH